MAESEIAEAQAATNLALTTLRDAMNAKKQALINGANGGGASSNANSNNGGGGGGGGDEAGTSVPLEKRPARKPRGRLQTQHNTTLTLSISILI